MASEAMRRGIARYQRKNMKVYAFKLHREYDADIIALLDAQENRQGYIKWILRKAIKEGKTAQE